MKVAILGTENCHAWFFSAKLLGKDGSKYFPDVELIGVYGDKSDPEVGIGNEELAKMSACPRFAEHYNDFLDEADAIMVTARDGDNHLKYAYEYLKKGIPVWFDKPVVGSVEDALKLAEMSKKYGSPICGGSSLVFTKEIVEASEYVKEHKDEILGGHITSQISMKNDYGDFWFYAQHMVQMVTAVFGTDVKSVTATTEGNTILAVYHYENYDVTAFGGTGFGVTVYKNNHDTISKSITLPEDFYMPELIEFYNMTQTRKGVRDFAEFFAPTFIIDATIRAYETGKEISVDYPVI